MNVIGDIAGQYDALMALLKKMPDQETLSVGDMIDRGPKSKEVVDWFMQHGSALLGNHEHMAMDWYREHGFYHPRDWERNGGDATQRSYEGNLSALAEAVVWMEGLPVKWEDDEVFVSHTFLDFGELDFGARIPEYLWNRSEPVSQDRFQIAGHNSHFGVRLWMSDLYSGQVAYALSIDASATKQIAGVDLNTMRIYTQEYI